MLKNVTLSADERLIEQARAKAQRENSSLNAVFRRWLATYAGREGAQDPAAQYDALMVELGRHRPGRTFSREEMNER